ncbi:HAD family hydrolase [bacterium CPR1]|nr:HAD family hydrolase [bacterium CPR1]
MVLLVAAGVSIVIGGVDEAVMIGLVLAINAALGAFQEWRAEKGAAALHKLLRVRARVIREGETLDVDAEELVPGDVVLLESGDRVPADVRLEWCYGLEVNESFLTGESIPVVKTSKGEGDKILAYAASTVVRGRARGVVEAIATGTAIGRLARDVTELAPGKSPLQVRMDSFTRLIAVATGGVVLLVGFLGMTLHQSSLLDTFFFGVALAVSAIPEGLPITMTVALSVAAARMARQGVIVRRLEAVEGLGSCTLVASDKTGTLTVNQLTATEARAPDEPVYQIEGAGFAPEGRVLQDQKAVQAEHSERLARLARVAILCNEGSLTLRDEEWVGSGDPTDVALLTLAEKLGLSIEGTREELPEVYRVPFEPELKYAASVHRDGHSLLVAVKGAPETVLSLSSGVEAAPWLSAAEEMARQGLRVLLLADSTLPHFDLAPDEFKIENLEPVALVGMVDPLRPEVPDAVAACKQAGVRVIMVTGDHPVTALAISRQLGLAERPDEVISGSELKNPEEALDRVRVFARTAPEQKLEIVQAAQSKGHFVAVTGDGVNDAPALRAANIGVAMGQSGTEVAREAASLVISDDNFATLVSGIREGRIAYSNVRKVVFLLVSTGVAEVLMVVGSFLVGMPVPLMPSQLLWLNLVTNGIQDKALAFEPAEGDELKRPPRKTSEHVFDRIMTLRVVLSALVMALLGMLTFRWALDSGWEVDAARNLLLFLFVVLEIVQIGNARSEKRSAFAIAPWTNPFLFFGSLLAFGLHLLAMVHPLGQRFLHTAPLDPGLALQVASLGLLLLLVMELQKLASHLVSRR